MQHHFATEDVSNISAEVADADELSDRGVKFSLQIARHYLRIRGLTHTRVIDINKFNTDLDKLICEQRESTGYAMPSVTLELVQANNNAGEHNNGKHDTGEQGTPCSVEEDYTFSSNKIVVPTDIDAHVNFTTSSGNFEDDIAGDKTYSDAGEDDVSDSLDRSENSDDDDDFSGLSYYIASTLEDVSREKNWDLEITCICEDSIGRALQALPLTCSVSHILTGLPPALEHYRAGAETSATSRFDRLLNGPLDHFGCILNHKACAFPASQSELLQGELACLFALLSPKLSTSSGISDANSAHAFVLTVNDDQHTRWLSATASRQVARLIIKAHVSPSTTIPAERSTFKPKIRECVEGLAAALPIQVQLRCAAGRVVVAEEGTLLQSNAGEHTLKRHFGDTPAVYVDHNGENTANTAEGIDMVKPRSPVKETSSWKRQPLGTATHNR